MTGVSNHRIAIHFILFSAVFQLLLSSCLQEKTCPGFDANDMTEFSYLTPDTLTFESDSSEVFQVFITAIILSETYVYECRDLYKICPCINYIEAEANDSRSSDSYTFLRMEESDVSEMQYFKYNVWGFEFEFDFINELPHIGEMEHLQHYPSLSIGNNVYYDVVAITNLGNEPVDIYQVYFNKQNGLLRFVEKSTNKVWTLKN